MAELFTYGIEGVPDLDQKRAGLPNNGSMYCVPVSNMNWLYFMAQHGKPSAVQLSSDMKVEPVVLMNIISLGSYMDTDPVDGTGYDDAFDGLVDWLDDHDVASIILGGCYSDEVDITMGRLRSLVGVGGLVSICMGRYKKDGAEFARTSGHCMTMVGLKQNGSKMQITVHNPADDSDLTKQSPVIPQSVALTHAHGEFEGSEVTLLRWGTSTNPFRFIDSYLATVPLFALTNVKRKLAYYSSTGWGNSVKSASIDLPFAGDVGDLAIQPDLATAMVTEAGGNVIWALDLLGQRWSRFAALKEPVGRITFAGRSQRLHATQGRAIVQLDRAGRIARATDLPFAAEAITYDQHAGLLVCASAAAGTVLRLDGGLRVADSQALPQVAGDGRLQLTVTPRDGTLVATRSGSPHVLTLRLHASGAVATGASRLLTKGLPAGIHADRKGRLIGSDDGKIATFDVDGNRLSGGAFDGLPAGPVLKVARSQHNFDRARIGRPEWRS